MSVGAHSAGPDVPDEQPHLKLFDPGIETIQKTLVQRACDAIGPSAAGDTYFSDAAHDCLMAVLQAPRDVHHENVWNMANMFLSRLLDAIGVMERLGGDATVLRELNDIRKRCIRTFPAAFAEPDRLP